MHGKVNRPAKDLEVNVTSIHLTSYSDGLNDRSDKNVVNEYSKDSWRDHVNRREQQQG